MGIWSTVGTALKNTISGSSKTNVEQISFDEKEEETNNIINFTNMTL